MLRRLAIIAAISTLLTLPSRSHAVIFTFSFDLADFLVSPSGPGGTYTPALNTPGVLLTGTSAAPILTIPRGASIEIGMDVSLSGPNQFGIGNFQMGITDANPAIAAVNASAGNGRLGSQRVGYGPSGNHGPTVNPFFVSINTTGRQVYGDNAGGVDPNLGMAGANVIAAMSNQTRYLYYGNQGPAELYNGLEIDTAGAVGTSARFTASNLNGALTYVIADPTDPGSYTDAAYSPASDTLTPLPALTLLIAPAVPEPTSLTLFAIGATSLSRRRR